MVAKAPALEWIVTTRSTEPPYRNTAVHLTSNVVVETVLVKRIDAVWMHMKLYTSVVTFLRGNCVLEHLEPYPFESIGEESLPYIAGLCQRMMDDYNGHQTIVDMFK